MRIASVVAASSVAILAAGCGGSHLVKAQVRSCTIRMGGLGSLSGYTDGNVLAAELPDGSLVVGAAHYHRLNLEIVLRRLRPDCRVVRAFGKGGTETVTFAAGHNYGTINALAATPHGALLLAGSDGRDALVGRLLANGSVDPSFGTNGWTRFRPRIPDVLGLPPSLPRVVTSIGFSPTGAIFLGGDDDTAHCCTTDFVSELTAGGALVRSFGNDGSVIVPKVSGSYITEVAPNPDGSVAVFVEYQQSGCGYPVVIRVRPDGSLDSAFDAAMARTLRRIAPTQYQFTPTLVPGGSGAFVLVGGFAKTCGPVVPNHLSLGLAAGVEPSGELDRSFGATGETRWPAAPDSLDNPSAVRLTSGRILLVSDAATRSGRLKYVLVRSLSAHGAVGVTRKIGRTMLFRGGFPAALLPSRSGGAWLVVIGSRRKIELIRTH